LTLIHSQLQKTSGEQVWRGSTVAIVATGILVFGWTWSLSYGLEFLLGFWLFLFGALPLEKGALTLVDYWFATRIILSIKVKVLRGGLCAYG
jgi:fatty acid desaturase